MGNFVVILGPPHTGKTTILAHVMKAMIGDGFDVITTTKIFRPPKGYHYVTKVSEFFRSYADANGNVIFAVDDAQAGFDSSSMASTKQARMNQTLYLLIAKLQANLIYIGHYGGRVPHTIMECQPLWVLSMTPGKMKIGNDNYNYDFSPFDFPKSAIPSWQWDIDPAKLYAALARVKGTTNEEIIKNNKATILEVLNGTHDDEDMVTKRETIEMIVNFLGDDMGKRGVHLSQSWIARRLGVTQSYVNQIVRSMKPPTEESSPDT